MIPIAVPLSTRVFSALRGSTVAAAAGVAVGTWASTTAPRVFRGFGLMVAGRNRGRLPFIEFDITGQQFAKDHYEGGTLTATVNLLAHCGGRDVEVSGNLLESMIVSGIAAIRSETSDNYVALGDESIEDAMPGPWGFKGGASLSISFSFSSFDGP